MSRLRNDLNNELVDIIVAKLLINTIQIVKKSNLQPLILTSDPFLPNKIDLDLEIKLDDGTSLNNAVRDCVVELEDDIILFLMPDLPGLTSQTLDKFLAVHSIHKFVITPTHDRGTALACLPRELFSKKFFGKNSADRFIRECMDNKIPISIFEITSIAHDLDTIEDWNLWVDYMNAHFFSTTN